MWTSRGDDQILLAVWYIRPGSDLHLDRGLLDRMTLAYREELYDGAYWVFNGTRLDYAI